MDEADQFGGMSKAAHTGGGSALPFDKLRTRFSGAFDIQTTIWNATRTVGRSPRMEALYEELQSNQTADQQKQALALACFGVRVDQDILASENFLGLLQLAIRHQYPTPSDLLREMLVLIDQKIGFKRELATDEADYQNKRAEKKRQYVDAAYQIVTALKNHGFYSAEKNEGAILTPVTQQRLAERISQLGVTARREQLGIAGAQEFLEIFAAVRSMYTGARKDRDPQARAIFHNLREESEVAAVLLKRKDLGDDLFNRLIEARQKLEQDFPAYYRP